MSIVVKHLKDYDKRALRRLLRQHYGKRRPSADEILQVIDTYKLRDKPKRGRKKK